jgi:flagellar hook-length control protein FliK
MNLADILNSASAQGKTLHTSGTGNAGVIAGPYKGPQALTADFTECFKAVAGENQIAAASLQGVDLKALFEQMGRQGDELLAQLMMQLQSAGMVPQEMMAGDFTLDATAANPIFQLQELLQDLLQSVKTAGVQMGPENSAVQSEGVALEIPQTAESGPGDASQKTGQLPSELSETAVSGKEKLPPQIMEVLEQAVATCNELLSFARIRESVIASQGHSDQSTGMQDIINQVSLNMAQDPKKLQGILVQQSSFVKIEKQIIAQPADYFGAMKLSGDGVPVLELFKMTTVEVQKVLVVWQEYSQNTQSASGQAAQNGDESPMLQSQGLSTLVQLLKTQVKTDAGKGQQEVLTPENPEETVAGMGIKPSGERKADLASLLSPGKPAENPVVETRSGQKSSDFDAVLAVVAKDGLFEKSSQTQKQDQPISLSQPERTIIHQMVDRIRMVTRNGVHEIRIQLDPPELGQVNMKIELNNSHLAARFTVDSEAVKQTVETHLNQLRDALAEQGIKVEKFDVHVGHEGGDPSHGKDVQDQWAMRRGWKNSRSNETDSGEAVLSLSGISFHGLETGKRYGYNTMEFIA